MQNINRSFLSRATLYLVGAVLLFSLKTQNAFSSQTRPCSVFNNYEKTIQKLFLLQNYLTSGDWDRWTTIYHASNNFLTQKLFYLYIFKKINLKIIDPCFDRMRKNIENHIFKKFPIKNKKNKSLYETLNETLDTFFNVKKHNFLDSLSYATFYHSLKILEKFSKKTQFKKLNLFLNLYKEKFKNEQQPLFRLVGHFKIKAPARYQAGVRPETKSVYASLLKIKPSEWFLILIHELCHVLDDMSAKSIEVLYQTGKKIKSFLKNKNIESYTWKSWTPDQKKIIDQWLLAVLNRNLFAEYRAWLVSRILYLKGQNKTIFFTQKDVLEMTSKKPLFNKNQWNQYMSQSRVSLKIFKKIPWFDKKFKEHAHLELKKQTYLILATRLDDPAKEKPFSRVPWLLKRYQYILKEYRLFHHMPPLGVFQNIVRE